MYKSQTRRQGDKGDLSGQFQDKETRRTFSEVIPKRLDHLSNQPVFWVHIQPPTSLHSQPSQLSLVPLAVHLGCVPKGGGRKVWTNVPKSHGVVRQRYMWRCGAWLPGLHGGRRKWRNCAQRPLPSVENNPDSTVYAPNWPPLRDSCVQLVIQKVPSTVSPITLKSWRSSAVPRLKTHLSADEHMQLYIAKCSFKKPKSGVESINWQPLRLKVAINICKSELHVSIYVEPPEFSLCLQEHTEVLLAEYAEV